MSLVIAIIVPVDLKMMLPAIRLATMVAQPLRWWLNLHLNLEVGTVGVVTVVPALKDQPGVALRAPNWLYMEP